MFTTDARWVKVRDAWAGPFFLAEKEAFAEWVPRIPVDNLCPVE